MHAPSENCPACGGQLSSWRTVPTSEPALGDARFELRRCRLCGSAVTVATPGQNLHETGAYRPGTPRLHRRALPVLRAFDRQRLTLVRSLARPPARLLDVGAGRGRFVASAVDAGYDASGIEPSIHAPDGAVTRASIGEATFPEGSVDVVTAWHMLEHLEQPGAGLTALAGWLRPGGGLLVGVPNLESVQALLGGDVWYHLDVPRHRVHFTPKGMDLLLRARGFTPVRTVHLLAEQNLFGMWQSLVNRVTRHPSYLYNLLKRNAPVRSPDLAISALALPLAPIAALVEVVAGLARRGGTIAVLARRGT